MEIFYSHTKKDRKFCDEFDNICATVGIKRFRSEFEKIDPPAWREILSKINQSVAIFVLVGKELVKFQDSNSPDWKFTQNWISYEIGLACEKGIDVWAICDDVSINFPMPYINNYFVVKSLKPGDSFDYLRGILDRYNSGYTFQHPYTNQETGENYAMECPYEKCKAVFNMHMKAKPGNMFRCPQCLNDMIFSECYVWEKS